MENTILIVEDEQRLAALHRDYLYQAGYATESIDDGAKVVAWILLLWSFNF